MKHQTFEKIEPIENGDTADLKRCLWLVRMNSATRGATVKSLAALRSVSGVDGELPVAIVRNMLDKLNNTFKKHMKKYCGLDLCLHVMRHLAGKVILDQDPSAMSLVQEILGHKMLRTTQSYYAEVSKIVAQRRYLHLLERQSRQVLANVKFKFIDPRTGKDI